MSLVLRRFEKPRDRWLFGGLALALLLVPIYAIVAARSYFGPALWPSDMYVNLDAAQRWLDGGAFYPAYELAGPFGDNGFTVVYPPVALWLFGPLALLPRALAYVLTVAAPIAALTWQWQRLRPAPLVWPFVALCVAWSPTVVWFVNGNAVLYALALLALATVYDWPAALIAVKASILPFAFWGCWRRSWWLAVGALALLSIPFGGMWLDWLTVLANSRIGGVLHSWQQAPTLAIPLLIYAGRTRS